MRTEVLGDSKKYTKRIYFFIFEHNSIVIIYVFHFQIKIGYYYICLIVFEVDHWFLAIALLFFVSQFIFQTFRLRQELYL